MASGVPVVATGIAVEGMHVVPERDCIVAHTVEALVDGLERVGEGHAPVCRMVVENGEGRGLQPPTRPL